MADNATHGTTEESCHNIKTMALKVSELIKLLEACPPDAEVMTEGCDCTGDAIDVEYSSAANEALITRTEVYRDKQDQPPTKPVAPPDGIPPSIRWGG